MDRVPSSLFVGPYLRVHEAIYRGTRGFVGKRLAGPPTLLLTTTGRKTGRMRTNALIYYRDGAAWVVVASNGGSDHAPGWLANLRAEPQVGVQSGRRKYRAVARVADAAERARLWPLVNRNNRGMARLFHRRVQGRYDVYQQSTAREIAVVVIEPL